MKKIKLSQIKENPSLIKEIRVKKYLPIANKQITICGFNGEDGKRYEGIVEMCLKQNEDGLHYVDFIDKEIVMVLSIVQAYCADSIEFDDIEVDSMYDFYVESGLWKYIIYNISEDEYKQFVGFVENTLAQEMKLKNSIEGIVASGINKIADVINTNLNPMELNKLVKTFSKEFKNFDLSKMEMVSSIFGEMNKEEPREELKVTNKLNSKKKNKKLN